MRLLTSAVLIGLTLTTAACTRPDRFGGGANGADANGLNGAGAAGINGGALGSASDPNSPAYFNEVVGDRVLFMVDQSTLTPQGMATLDGQANWLSQHPDYLAVIEGHADEQGTREYNLALGARRANAVNEYLISKGIAPNRIRTISYGKERPIATCADDSCYSQNRRAVTVISIGSLG